MKKAVSAGRQGAQGLTKLAHAVISSAGNMDIGGSFVAAARSNLEVLTSRPVSSAGRVSTERSSCGHGSALLDWALEQSHVPGSSHGVGRGCGSGSTKNKATRILVWI
jgi:hypothetical protein